MTNRGWREIRIALYQHFLDGVPWYLARHYWWAYLWDKSIWFFDHQPVINAILFGHYQRLMDETLSRYQPGESSRTLQLTCVYGKLTPTLKEKTPAQLHIMDACIGQLELAQRKSGTNLHAARMDAESLAYRSDTFDHVILFFLLHEMPPEARENTLREAVRVLKSGGRLLITEYGEKPEHHWLYQFFPFRWLLGNLEPFLPGFWQESLNEKLQQAANENGKKIEIIDQISVFSGFYRVVEYRVLV